MASDQILNNLFNYGDSVRVKENAPIQYNPNAIGSISGIRQIKSETTVMHFQQPPGSYLYLIELSNGNSLEIPEIYLNKLN